ncbi:hypothetical protein [Chitinophaga sp.]
MQARIPPEGQVKNTGGKVICNETGKPKRERVVPAYLEQPISE